MGFTVRVWNIRQFDDDASTARIQQVENLIKRGGKPDVFAILEFRAKDIARQLISERFKEYDFAMTDSKVQLDFLIGWKRDRFAQVLFTQRRDFQIENIDMRPGGLLSFREPHAQSFHNLLVLHTDSGREKKDYDGRQAMFSRIWSLKRALEALPIQKGKARLIAAGDLNTMGRKKVGSFASISASAEIQKLASDAAANGMRLLSKSSSLTERTAGGSLQGDLDHVIASNDLAVQQRTDPARELNPYEVEVQGWVELAGAARQGFIENISDHCALFLEVL